MKYRNPIKVRFNGRVAGAVGLSGNLTETVEHGSDDSMRLALYDGKTLSGIVYENISKFEVLTVCYTSDDLTPVNNDVNGNPRYVIHYTALITDLDRETCDISERYQLAIAKAKKLFGGRKFHNRQYGGGIVFQSYSVDTELRLINELHNKAK